MPSSSAAFAAARSALEDAPTTLYDEPEPDLERALDAGEAASATVEQRRDPWAAVGLRLGAGLAAQYQPTEILATGGPLTALLARHRFLDRHVLIKALAREAAGTEEARAFLAEATALWQLSHPSFPAVLEYGSDQGGRPFVIMEYATGEALAERLRDGIGGGLALDVASQIVSALAAAHARGVAHGALSADAIHLCDDSALPGGVRVKIADFAAGLPARGGEETRVVVARALGAARPDDDLAAVGALLAALRDAAGPALSPAVARGLGDLARRLGDVAPPSLAEAAVELRRLEVEENLSVRAGRTAEVPLVPRTPGPLWLGGAVFGGAIAFVALLGAIL